MGIHAELESEEGDVLCSIFFGIGCPESQNWESNTNRHVEVIS